MQVLGEHWEASQQVLELPQERTKSNPINRVAVRMAVLFVVLGAVGPALDTSR